MKIHRLVLVLIFSAILLFTGCSKGISTGAVAPSKEGQSMVKDQTEADHVQSDAKEQKESGEEKPDEEKTAEIDLEKVKPNEAGEIMVLMYHHISQEETEWGRTPENFKKDLQYMYDHGYRPISLRDYATGNINTKAGYTPIVITFDDGWQNNFNMIQDDNGKWVTDPESAVGILENFKKEHPDFPIKATFFVNDNIPFGQKEHLEYKFKHMNELGLDIGNHTASHIQLNGADAEKIQKELAAIVTMVKGVLPDYQVNTLALPFGSRPKAKNLYPYLEKGEYSGVKYQNVAILNVGWDPYKSPYHKSFNPLAIHRVRASELEKYVQNVGLYSWFNQFEKGSRKRFISDGQADIVTVPEKYKDVIDTEKLGDRKLVTYEMEKVGQEDKNGQGIKTDDTKK